MARLSAAFNSFTSSSLAPSQSNETLTSWSDGKLPSPKSRPSSPAPATAIASRTENRERSVLSLGIAPRRNTAGPTNPHNPQHTRQANEPADPITNTTPRIPSSSWSTCSCRSRRAGSLPRVSTSACRISLTAMDSERRFGTCDGFVIHAGSDENQQIFSVSEGRPRRPNHPCSFEHCSCRRRWRDAGSSATCVGDPPACRSIRPRR